ncbi:hypothetical protein FS749_004179 [Ceratobasidium sp. UAMH 11750]|nr:hypothetical protein FS749_004179 [Ceratobasidium sp. UAMH 11750]
MAFGSERSAVVLLVHNSAHPNAHSGSAETGAPHFTLYLEIWEPPSQLDYKSI